MFVVWEDFRRTGSASDRSQVDLYAQRVTPEGTIASGWPVDGLPLCTARGSRFIDDVLPDGVGGLFIELTSMTLAPETFWPPPPAVELLPPLLLLLLLPQAATTSAVAARSANTILLRATM